MKTQKLALTNFKVAALSLALLGLVACKAQSSSSFLPDGAIPALEEMAPSGNMGSSSGGGGFAEEGAKAILDKASQELAASLRQASPALFAGLPEGWTQEKMAEVVGSLQYDFTRSKNRHGKELMMDYGVRKGTPYLVALKAFSNSLAAAPLIIKSESEIQEYVDQAKIRIAHELFHLLGYGTSDETDSQARVLGYRLLNALSTDFVICSVDEAEASTTPTSPETYDADPVVPIFFLIQPSALSLSMIWGPVSTAQADSLNDWENLRAQAGDRLKASDQLTALSTFAKIQSTPLALGSGRELTQMMSVNGDPLVENFNRMDPAQWYLNGLGKNVEITSPSYEDGVLSFQDTTYFAESDHCPYFLFERTGCTENKLALRVDFALDFNSGNSGYLDLAGNDFREIDETGYDTNQSLQWVSFSAQVSYACQNLGDPVIPTEGELNSIASATDSILKTEESRFLELRKITK